MKREGGRKLLEAFLGNSRESMAGQRAMMEQMAAPAGERSLGSMMEHLLELEPETWYLYAWSRDPLEGKFSDAQKLAYGRKAARCGRYEADLLLAQTGKNAAEAAGTDIWSLAADMGLTVSTPRTPNGGGHVIFAQYQEPDSVTVFMDSADKARDLIREEKLESLLAGRAVEDVLLAHELFHVTEYRKRDTIYTRTEKVELWRKPFSNRSCLICLGEIAGMEFARRLTGIPYTPYILDVLMMYGYDKGAAAALYEEIASFAGDGGGKEG